jgi:hypothetical protein
MATTQTAPCKPEAHKMHMCQLKMSGFEKENPAEFKKLTTDPKYKCANCGAQAHDSKNLCKPAPL